MTLYTGVDVSLTATAVVSIDETGEERYIFSELGYPLKSSSTTWEEIERAEIIAKGVVSFINGKKFSAIEGYAYAAKGRSILQIAELGGIIRHMILQQKWEDKPVFIPPTSLKKFCTGKGRADKKKIAECVKIIWNFSSKDDNIVDAYVLAQMMRYSDESIRPTLPIMDFQLDALKAIGLW